MGCWEEALPPTQKGSLDLGPSAWRGAVTGSWSFALHPSSCSWGQEPSQAALHSDGREARHQMPAQSPLSGLYWQYYLLTPHWPKQITWLIKPSVKVGPKLPPAEVPFKFQQQRDEWNGEESGHRSIFQIFYDCHVSSEILFIKK